MEDHELELMLRANRWMIDIPADKDGWELGFETSTLDKEDFFHGPNVHGGSQIVLLTRRDQDSDRIEYSWYETAARKTISQDSILTISMSAKASGSGGFKDPIAKAGVTLQRPDGVVKSGEVIYRGGESSVSSGEKSDFEVRVVLVDPKALREKQTVE